MKITFSLIHNNNEDRNHVIDSSLQKLAKFIEDEGDIKVTIVETYYQPRVVPLSPELTLSRKKLFALVRNQWATYLGHAPHLAELPPITMKEQSNGAVELMLSDKHVRSWDKFLDSNDDLIVSFEDDATISDESFPKLLAVLTKAFAYPKEISLYADLAGGIPMKLLKVDGLIQDRDGEFIAFKKPVTNTACCYILNRLMAINFKTLILPCPDLRLIPADWMINKLLLELDRDAVPMACFHTDPPIFIHGSLAKIWPSRVVLNE